MTAKLARIACTLCLLWAAPDISAQAQTGLSMLPSDPTPSFRLQGLSTDNWVVSDVEGQPFSRVWRLKTPNSATSGNPYDFFLTGHAQRGITLGDLLVATVWIRSVSAVYGQAYTRFVVQEDQPPYTKSAEWFLSAGSSWKQFQIPFRVAKSNDADSYSIQFWISSGPQEIEIAGLQMSNYGPNILVRDLGLPGYPYEGFADKAWLPEAEARIEKFRKGDAVVAVRDENGVPMAGADVDVRMKSHQFGFGSAVDSDLLLGGDADAVSYRRTILDNFNRATLESDLKWPQWIDNRDLALKGLDWLKSNGIKQVRGHNLVWPGWQYLPTYLLGFAANPSGLEAEIEKHIREETAATAGRLTEWDVINEPVTNVALQSILGNPIMAKWFKVAREKEPTARLYVNDYSLLEGGANDTPHQAGLEAVVQILDANEAGLQGIGLQAHYQWQLTEVGRLYDVVTRFAGNKRDVQVTELDVDVEDPGLQAEYLSDFLTMSFSHPAISGITLWGFWEGRHFRPNAALWRKDWTLKPAGRVWRDLVYKKWWTQLTTQSDADGLVRFRGFAGTYEAIVRANGRQQVIDFELAAGQTNYVIVGKSQPPQLGAMGVLNGASFAPGAVSPGETIAIFGSDFGRSELVRAAPDANGELPAVVGDVAVLVDGTPARMLYSGNGQAGAVLPLSIRGTARIQVDFLGLESNEVYLPVADASPGIYARSGGNGQALVVNGQGGIPNSVEAPAARGEAVTFFATGLGWPVAGAPPNGARVLLGDLEAKLQSAEWIRPGVYQIKALIPADAQVGGAIPLSVSTGNFRSQEGVTMAIR